MKKFFSIVLLLFAVVPAVLCFTACDKKEPDNQITILQIYDAINEQKSNLSGLEDSYISDDYGSASLMLQKELEIRNIDSEEFMLGYQMDIAPRSLDPRCKIYILKFRSCDSAKNCVEKLGLRETFSKTITLNFKQYGNLIVGVDDNYYQQIFEIIDKI